jgi:hypothetical protein
MGGDPLVPVEYLDGGGGQAGLDLLAEQGVRDAVEVLLDFDVVVDADPAPLPFRVDVGSGRQRPQGRAFQLVEQLPSAEPKMTHEPVVQVIEQSPDRHVELFE